MHRVSKLFREIKIKIGIKIVYFFDSSIMKQKIIQDFHNKIFGQLPGNELEKTSNYNFTQQLHFQSFRFKKLYEIDYFNREIQE